jgi:hypothetical protein
MLMRTVNVHKNCKIEEHVQKVLKQILNYLPEGRKEIGCVLKALNGNIEPGRKLYLFREESI